MKKNHKNNSLIFLVLIIAVILFFVFSQSDGNIGSQLLVNLTSSAPYLSDKSQTASIQAVVELHTNTLVLPTNTSTATVAPTDTLTPTATPTPEYFGVEIIGRSVMDRPLEVYRFGNGEPAYMIIAGIHGGYEWNTVELAYELIDLLIKEPERVPQNRTLYVLPNLNPDGYEKDKGPDGRANANNVDINRNWDANWQANWYGKNCWSYRFITAGTGPESEPETQALKDFLIEMNIEAVISYHSAAGSIFSGGYPYDEESINLANQLSIASSYRFPPNYGDCLYTGQFIDWTSAQGIPSVDIELRNHVDTDYLINVNVLKAFLNWENPSN
ncbi:MAG: M14 family metallopeptidase [Anaerolineaceae bacterium]|jgi:predicted deacylase